MSYQTNNNPQQKSLGIVLVIALHAVLIWALANGLGAVFFKPDSEHFVRVVPNKQPDPPATPTPIVEPLQTSTPVITFTQPQPIEIPTEQPLINQPIVDVGIPPITINEPTITKPQLKKATKPDYPAASERLGEEGATGLQLLINEDGRVTQASITSSSGSDRLDQAAVKHAQRSWIFSPCMAGDKPVACAYQTKFVWRLEDAKR